MNPFHSAATPRFGATVGSLASVLLMAAALAATVQSVAAQTPHPAVVRVVVPEGAATAYGSGTLVDVRDEYGLVITNWHVLRDATGEITYGDPSEKEVWRKKIAAGLTEALAQREAKMKLNREPC